MLIREHYARNEIKWQHEVICLSLNWVFLAGGPPYIFLVLHLDKLNEKWDSIGMCCSLFFSVLYFFFWSKCKTWQTKCSHVSRQRIHSHRTFSRVGCMRRQWKHWVKFAMDSEEFCSYSSALGLFYPAGYSLVSLSCLEEGLTAAPAGAARITKVKDYLHMVFLTRKREIL